MPAPVIVWFRQDLRLGDNPALQAALDLDRPIVPVYIRDDTAAGRWQPGGASRWWLHGSLGCLDADLRPHVHERCSRADLAPHPLEQMRLARACRPQHE